MHALPITTFAMSNNTSIASFAMLSAFDTAAWNIFKNTQKTTEQNSGSQPVTNTHTNTTPHTNTVGHTNVTPHSNTSSHNNTRPHSNSTGAHTNRAGSHTNNAGSHSNTTSTINTTKHTNAAIPRNQHTNSTTTQYHSNSMQHQNVAAAGKHMNFSVPNKHTNNNRVTNGTVHTNYVQTGKHDNWSAHWDKYGQTTVNTTTATVIHTNTTTNVPTSVHSNGTTPHANSTSLHSNIAGSHSNSIGHNNSTPHTNVSGTHTNTGGHTNISAHVNTGFDHVNYKPSTPNFFNLVNDININGVSTIAICSYDRNKDGLGTQDGVSKLIYYDLEIRKVLKLDGTTPDPTPWLKVVDNIQEDSTLGLLYSLNTVDPMQTGNTDPSLTEGYYELRATARNMPFNGNTYDSQQQIIRVKIKQEVAPTLSINNGNEVVNFTFSKQGALKNNGTYKTWLQGLYSDPYATNFAENTGLFVALTMFDEHPTQYQKGIAKLKDDINGNIIATTDIWWSDVASDRGATSVQSNNISKKGYIYFDKASLPDTVDITTAIIEITVKNYLDASCTQPTSVSITQSTISPTDNTPLKVAIDTKNTSSPGLSLSTNWTNAASVSVTIVPGTDTFTGTAITEYMLSGATTQGWTLYSGPFNITAGGQTTITARSIDNVGNVSVSASQTVKIDRIAPAPPTISSPTGFNTNSTVSIALTPGLDSDSGVNRMEYMLSGAVNQTWTLYTGEFSITTPGSTTITAREVDNVGNTSSNRGSNHKPPKFLMIGH